MRQLAEEQAALRRVATLVARGVQPAEIFSAVAEEIRPLLGAENAGMSRFEPDGTSVVVVSADRAEGDPVPLPAGRRVELRDWIPSGIVWRTRRAAQADEDLRSTVSDPVADRLRELGIRSSAASPIIVDGRLWGMVSAWTRRGPFPAGTADRMADFTELLATAVGNAQSRAELAASRTRIVATARLPEPIEVAAYYVASEALTNATKHAHASVVRVAVEERDDCLHLSVRDDGAGGADPARGSGLIGLRDRAEALGGSLEVCSPPGEGTLISVQLPLQLH